MPPASESPERDAQGRRVWRVGTLVYTSAGLVVLFCWLLWGDFAWSLRERAGQPMAQLLLKQFKASDLIVGLLVTSLPAALGMLLGPIIGVKSDNHRGRLGRRIPYLLVPMPIAVAAMIGMGYTPLLANLLGAALGHLAPDPVACRLIVFGALWTVFEIFTVIGNAVFVGLINDVVPQPVIGRFFALFRIGSLAAGIFFNSVLIGHADEHYKAIFLGLAALYCLSFLLMCLMVKEGDYPPPQPRKDEAFLARVAAPVKAYLRECASTPFYLWVFLASMLGTVAFLPINSFDVAYAQSIDLDLRRFGDLRSITYAISIALAFFIGWLADKLHPIRLGLFSLGTYAAIALWAGFGAQDKGTFSIAYVAHGVLSGIFYTGTASLFPRLFPRAKFTQFTSAAGIILALGYIGVPLAVGRVLDLTQHAYHYTFVIGGCVAAAGCAAFLILHRQFIALGGMKHYRPPG